MRGLIRVRVAARVCRRTAETVCRWVKRGFLAHLKLRGKGRGSSSELAVLSELAVTRERIRRRAGGSVDVLGALDRSREAHP